MQSTLLRPAPMGLMAVAPRSEVVREELRLVDWDLFSCHGAVISGVRLDDGTRSSFLAIMSLLDDRAVEQQAVENVELPPSSAPQSIKADTQESSNEAVVRGDHQRLPLAADIFGRTFAAFALVVASQPAHHKTCQGQRAAFPRHNRWQLASAAVEMGDGMACSCRIPGGISPWVLPEPCTV
jgi:hypothetical protein